MPEASSPTHIIRPGERTLQLRIPIVLPGIERDDDGCIGRLSERIAAQTGVSSAHLEGGNLCLHYDPNLLALEKLERMAKDEGAQITRRYKHETIIVKGMDCASCAASIEHSVKRMNGVLSVTVNYAVEKLKVEYDSTLINRDAIAAEVKKLGYRIPAASAPSAPAAPQTGHENCNHEGHDHSGHDHSKHGHEESSHEGHEHGEVDPNAPWLLRNPELARSLMAGALLAIGFFGGLIPGFPAPIALGFILVSCFAGGYDLARHTVPATLRGRFDVEFLMLLGAIGAGLLGQWAEGAFLLFLFSFGHALEGFAMDSARNAIGALGKLTPKVARIKTESGEVETPLEQIQIGQIAVVRPGDRVPVDGIVVAGRSAIDQSPITGESVPVEKTMGESVFAGTINGDGALEIEVTKLAADSTIARVLEMVEEAQSQKAPSQTFTDKFEKILVPCVLGVTFLAATVPPIVGWLDWRTAIFRAISTVVAASPCALALATPAAVLSAIARAAQNGVLIKGGVHLENLGSLRAIAFDKTGTLTRGKPEISDVLPVAGVSESELLGVAAALESRSSHPLAQAVVRRASELKLALPASGDLQTIQGQGVMAEIDGQIVRIGNAKLMESAGIAVPTEVAASLQTLGESGKPTMIIARDAQILGVLALADGIRDESKAALQTLREIGITNLVMLTGDNARVAAKIAPQAGVTEFRADLLPEAKVAALQELMQQHGQVAMVGDGVNDAPALALATVGIAMGAGGTDVALETADVALMADDLSRLPFAVALSRQAKSIIRQNLWIALGVIALLVPSTLFGFARLGVAVVFHEGSTLVVVANALRLLRFRLKPSE